MVTGMATNFGAHTPIHVTPVNRIGESEWRQACTAPMHEERSMLYAVMHAFTDGTVGYVEMHAWLVYTAEHACQIMDCAIAI